MANNRIYIRCLGCLALKSIAKYYPWTWGQHQPFEDFTEEHQNCKEWDVNEGPTHFDFKFESEEDFRMYKDDDQWRYRL